MATLVKCNHCGVMTYSLRPGETCSGCHQGEMKPDDAESDYRGIAGKVDAPAGSLAAGEADQNFTKNASAFGVDQPDNPPLVVDHQAQPRKGPKVTGHDGADLWDLLRDGLFHKAKDLAMENRKIRAVCAVYPNQFLSTQQGYKIVKQSTDAEIEIASADLGSRMAHLGRRKSALDSVLRDRKQRGFDL
jgi:hypothetical protein